MWQKSSGRTCATDYLGTERLRLTPSLTLTRYSESKRTKLTMPRRSPTSTERSRAHATGAEFCKAFAENIDSMHVLSFLLTADLTKAENCFLPGLEDCVTASCVFRDWARSWTRRTIIQNAVRRLAPSANQSAATGAPSETASSGLDKRRRSMPQSRAFSGLKTSSALSS
jgi:hypothetical protein